MPKAMSMVARSNYSIKLNFFELHKIRLLYKLFAGGFVLKYYAQGSDCDSINVNFGILDLA